MLKGKRISILGDSISTYKGVSNNVDANITTFANPYKYADPFPFEKTYWMLIINTFNMTLCVNNSWSGGNLSGKHDESSGMNRAHHLANNDGDKPEFIILFMGRLPYNPFGNQGKIPRCYSMLRQPSGQRYFLKATRRDF